MRTTLTINDDLDKKLRDIAHIQRRSYKEVVNEIIRAGLASKSCETGSAKRFRVQAKHYGFRTGVDLGKLNQAVDELEVDDFIEKGKSL